MKGVQCYELFGGIALKNHTFSFFHSVIIMTALELVKNRMLLASSSEDICQLIKFILEHKVFTFNGEYFQQVCSTAMGPGARLHQ